MLTGDAQESADAVAKETGIDEVHAKLLPQDKLSELKKIRENHGAVMFVGDGINDAPVLAGADVGAAMGSGADAAIEAADVVFMNSEMKAIPEAIGIAKMTNSISWQNVVFALAIKIIVMIMGLCIHKLSVTTENNTSAKFCTNTMSGNFFYFRWSFDRKSLFFSCFYDAISNWMCRRQFTTCTDC